MKQPVPLSVVALFDNADIVVKRVLLLLLAGSVWSWAVIVDKLWRLARGQPRGARITRRGPPAARAPQELWDAQRAMRSEPAGAVLAAGDRGMHRRRGQFRNRRRAARAHRTRDAAGAQRRLRQLESRLPFLATLGSAAPFIGLFGTVWGIMRSFNAIAAANNTSLAVVAPGIAEALFATAMGLAAAIPAVVAYNKFTVELGRFAGRMQGLIGRSGALARRARPGRERWRVLLPPSGEAGDGEDRYQPLAEINVTPMVDVMLVLLVIFMVTAPLLTVGVPLNLPKTSAAEITQPKKPIVVAR